MDAIASGFAVALSLTNLTYCFAGVLLGTAIGVLPGIGALAAVSMLLPITYYLDPVTAVILLGGVYYGAEYGGSTASILLNLPGTPSNAVTCLDGYPMAQKGRAGVALFATTIASFIGGSIGIILMMAVTPLVVAIALAIGPSEYFALILFGLVAAGTVTQGSPIKGLMMVALGLVIGCIGMDIYTGRVRYSFGFLQLQDGISIVVLAMGLFGVSEVIASIGGNRRTGDAVKVSLRSMLPTRDEVRRSIFPTLRGSAVGSIAGPLPGTGPTLAAFASYILEKRVSRDPSRFGKGAIEGLAGPESANNAAAQTAFIPTLSMGIPGTPTMAVILGALLVHGIQPGPRLIAEMPDLFWGVVASFWIGNLFLLVLNLPFIGIWVRILQIPYRFLYPVVLCLICIGVYSINSSVFDIWLVLIFGLVGYVLRLLEFEPAPLLFGFILGPLLEDNFRRSMLIFHGDFMRFFQQPITVVLLAMSVLFIASVIWFRVRPPQGAQLASGE